MSKYNYYNTFGKIVIIIMYIYRNIVNFVDINVILPQLNLICAIMLTILMKYYDIYEFYQLFFDNNIVNSNQINKQILQY